MENEKTVKIFKNIAVTFCGAIALWIVTSLIAHFNYPDYFYQAHPDIQSYVGVNVVSPFADFAFFTYITLILFGARCLLTGLSGIFKLDKILNFLRRDTISVFVFLNYSVTVTFYTAFELLSFPPTLGWYGNYPLSWHTLGTNVIAHYLLFIAETVIFIKEPTTKGNLKSALIIVSAFLIVYYAAVKITGEFAYNIRWFPYIIFDARSFGNGLSIDNVTLSTVLLVFILTVVFTTYLLAFILLVKAKSKKLSVIDKPATKAQ